MIEKLAFNVAYEEIGIARSHCSAHGDTIDLLEKEKQLSVKTSSAWWSKVAELGSFVERLSK